MKTFAIALIGSLASAARVHEFYAEAHNMCQLCKQAVEFANNDKIADLEALYKTNPALQSRINAFVDDAEVYNYRENATQACQYMSLCDTANVYDLLMEETPLDLDRHIEFVNSNPKSNWVAGRNDKFEGASLKEIKSLMGTIVDPEWAINLHEKRHNITNDLPESFDARTNWPECESVINHVRDQANCGSCWAHGTTEALNDRLCIASGGAFTTLLSVADTTGCCGALQCSSFGCNGG